jgi:hypothetical protein
MTGNSLFDLPNLLKQTLTPSEKPQVGSLKLGRTMPCCFDWEPQRRGRRLRCAAHKHVGFQTSVLVLPHSETLADLLRQDRLQGEALADAEKESRER